MLPKYSASPDRYKLLKEFARENRKHMTDAEVALWTRIRDNQLGFAFLRQYVVFDFIVDFVCRERKLVIEVDGGYHSEPRQQEDDQNRELMLNVMGYRVIRFANEEVIGNIDEVVRKIKATLNQE